MWEGEDNALDAAIRFTIEGMNFTQYGQVFFDCHYDTSYTSAFLLCRAGPIFVSPQ
jgi:hypothetical protein